MLAVLGHFSFDRWNFTDLMTRRGRIIAQQEAPALLTRGWT
jgi:hypothetical protein